MTCKEARREPGEDWKVILWITRNETAWEKIITITESYSQVRREYENDFGFSNQNIIVRHN